jgi:hypothetical protein
MIKPLPLQCLLLAFSIFLLLPNSEAQNLDDYRTNGNVTFATVDNWQAYNGTAWIAATTPPNATHGIITIRNGHTASVTTDITLDQVVIEDGGTFWLNTNGVTFTLNDDPGGDVELEIKTGGTYIHGKKAPDAASMEPPTGAGKIQIQPGGILRLDNAGLGHAD